MSRGKTKHPAKSKSKPVTLDDIKQKIKDFLLAVKIIIALVSVFVIIITVVLLNNPIIIEKLSILGMTTGGVGRTLIIAGMVLAADLLVAMRKHIWKGVKQLKEETAKEESKASIESSKQAVSNRPGLPPLSVPKEGKNKSVNSERKEDLKRFFELYGLDYVTIKQEILGPRITTYILDTNGEPFKNVVRWKDEAAAHFNMEEVMIRSTKRGLEMQLENEVVETVMIGDVLEEYLKKPKTGFPEEIEVPIGRLADGEMLVLNISQGPHTLIAGATGSGKSVNMNAIITGIITLYEPHEVKMYLVDPKKVELADYNGIPHVIGEVVTDKKLVAPLLQHIVTLMNQRYSLFEEDRVRDLRRYNKKNASKPLPHIIVIIDEIAEVMLQSGAEVEESIQSLGQLARAAGIHLLLATQRPSVDVVTGIIKSNIPTRIAFSCSSQTDARIIMDTVGAEKLLGQGDGLIKTVKMMKAERFQSAFVGDSEIEAVTKWWKQGMCKKPLQEHGIVLEKADEIADESIDVDVSDQEKRVFYYLYERMLETEESVCQLPPTKVMREEIGIKKTTLIEIINDLEERGMVQKSGSKRGAKIELLLENQETIDFIRMKCGA